MFQCTYIILRNKINFRRLLIYYHYHYHYMFPPKLVDETINSYLNDKVPKNVEENNVNETNGINTFFKLPYEGEHSTYVSNKIKSLCKQYCKNTEVKLSFSMAKVGDVFSLKSRIPSYLKFCVVYYFVCAGCNANYVGETVRHLDTRIHEHFNKATSPSNIFRH